MRRDRFFIMVLALLLVRPAGAELSGASFLKIGVGARALGMGGAFTGVADDATAIYWNPAGLSQLDRPELHMEYSQWIADADRNHLAYVHPVSAGTIGFAVSSLGYPEADGRDEMGQRNGSFDSRDTAVTLSFARAAVGSLSIGVNAKFIQQAIAGESASGMAADFGLHMRGDVISAGISVHNLGPRLKFSTEEYALPLDITAGIGVRLFDRIHLETDVKRLMRDRRTSLQCGVEYSVSRRMALRSGYLLRAFEGDDGTDRRDAPGGTLSGFNMGLGIKLFSLALDYAAVPSSESGELHHFSLSSKF